MKILIISDSYPPEVRSSAHLMKDLAEGLSERNHEVFVVTSLPSRVEVKPGIAKENGVNVIRVPVISHHNVNFIQKGISQMMLPYVFFRQVKKHIKDGLDAVWVHSPPLPLAKTAELVKKKYGAKYFLNLHDFFPQNAVDLGILKNPFLIKMFERMERRAYESADSIVTPSESHKNYMIEKRDVPAEKIRVVSHWIDIEPFDEAEKTGKFRKQYGLDGKFIFVFGGVIGPSQGLDMFIRIAEKLKKHEDIAFLFVGEGSEKKRLMGLARSLKTNNVFFKPFVPEKDYPRLLKDADVGILSLTSENTTPAVPAKLMGYMAAGMPVLAFLHKESDGLRMVEDAKCGLTTISDDEDKMTSVAEKIYLEKDKLSEYGKNGREYVLKNFTKDVCLEKVGRIL